MKQTIVVLLLLLGSGFSYADQTDAAKNHATKLSGLLVMAKWAYEPILHSQNVAEACYFVGKGSDRLGAIVQRNVQIEPELLNKVFNSRAGEFHEKFFAATMSDLYFCSGNLGLEEIKSEARKILSLIGDARNEAAKLSQ